MSTEEEFIKIIDKYAHENISYSGMGGTISNFNPQELLELLQSQGFCISRWRPIEDIEKDGREVLVACKEVEGEVHGIGENPCGVALVSAGADMPFYMTHGDYYSVEAVNPTHFTDLPTPPKGGE